MYKRQEYARTHPERRVLLIDMCPQANLSATALTHLLVTDKILTYKKKKNQRKAGDTWSLHRGEPIVNRLMGTAFQHAQVDMIGSEVHS